jgi:hypothetical protein
MDLNEARKKLPEKIDVGILLETIRRQLPPGS